MVCCLIYSQLRSSFVSVVFAFNALLNDVVSVSPMPLSVDLMKMKKSGLQIDVRYICFFCLTFDIKLSERCV